jgi:hypothetical protein
MPSFSSLSPPCGAPPPDLYHRVNMIGWGRAKTFGAVMLLVRAALNMYSVITNVTSLDEGRDNSYKTVRKIVFYFELIVVCIMLALSLLYLASALWAKVSWAKYNNGKKMDVFTGKPFKPAYRSLRAQVCAAHLVCCVCQVCEVTMVVFTVRPSL